MTQNEDTFDCSCQGAAVDSDCQQHGQFSEQADVYYTDAAQRAELHRLGQVITRLRAQLQRAQVYISAHVYTGYDHAQAIQRDINSLLKDTMSDGE